MKITLTIETTNFSSNFLCELVRKTDIIEILSDLAKDENGFIKEAVAGNPNTPAEILSMLAKDEYVNVKVAVADNPNTSPEILSILSKDDYWYVRKAAKNNPNFK